MAKNEEELGTPEQIPLQLDRSQVTPGSLNDAHMIRVILGEAIRLCGKSRAQIADEMSFLTGTRVTDVMLNGFSAESRTDIRWPAEFARAFAMATGDDRILKCQAEAAGYRVISGPDIDLLEIGRQYLRRKRSEEEITERERRLKGMEL